MDYTYTKLETFFLMGVSLLRVSKLGFVVSLGAVPLTLLGFFLGSREEMVERSVQRCIAIARKKEVPDEVRNLWKVGDEVRVEMLAFSAAVNITLPLWPFPGFCRDIQEQAAPQILRKWAWKLSQEA